MKKANLFSKSKKCQFKKISSKLSYLQNKKLERLSDDTCESQIKEYFSRFLTKIQQSAVFLLFKILNLIENPCLKIASSI